MSDNSRPLPNDKQYVPDRGDIVWLNFDPQAGREQAGRRPALVLSPKAYNAKTRLAVICPITKQIKGYPFEVGLANDRITGVILADQVRNLDWIERRAEKAAVASSDEISDVVAKISALCGA